MKGIFERFERIVYYAILLTFGPWVLMNAPTLLLLVILGLIALYIGMGAVWVVGRVVR